MDEIFIKTPPRTRNRNSYVELPSHGHHPRVCGHADATFPAQPHAMSAFHRPDTKIYGETDKTNKKTTRFSSVTYHNFSSKKTAAPTNCNPFYFQPISEDPHIFHPIATATTTRHHLPRNASRLIQDPEALGSQRPSASTDIHLLHVCIRNFFAFILPLHRHRRRLRLPFYDYRHHQLRRSHVK
ncbi:hypothetical protein MHU86_20353 [Fragilaria crotonensis]|nr:hypothetical protein MHU86_20353 [Fragilaria crotonensis]